jgi:xylose isomerase
VPQFFQGVDRVRYGGPGSRDPLTFRYSNREEGVCVPGACRPMKDWCALVL